MDSSKSGRSQQSSDTVDRIREAVFMRSVFQLVPEAAFRSAVTEAFVVEVGANARWCMRT